MEPLVSQYIQNKGKSTSLIIDAVFLGTTL
jgi:hypothetical protein